MNPTRGIGMPGPDRHLSDNPVGLRTLEGDAQQSAKTGLVVAEKGSCLHGMDSLKNLSDRSVRFFRAL